MGTGLAHQFGDLMSRLWPLNGQQGQLWTLLQLHVIALKLSLHPGQILIAGGGVDDQPITARHQVDDHVVDHAALLVEHGAVQGATGGVQSFDIVGQQILQPLLGLKPGDVDHGHMRDIKNPTVAAHLMVLLNLRAVMQRHIPTAKIDHLRA